MVFIWQFPATFGECDWMSIYMCFHYFEIFVVYDLSPHIIVFHVLRSKLEASPQSCISLHIVKYYISKRYSSKISILVQKRFICHWSQYCKVSCKVPVYFLNFVSRKMYFFSIKKCSMTFLVLSCVRRVLLIVSMNTD